MLLPGYDLSLDWSVPAPWKVAYMTFDQIGDHYAWGVKLENTETGQYTLGHFDPSLSISLARAIDEATTIKPPVYRTTSSFSPPRSKPTIDSLLDF